MTLNELIDAIESAGYRRAGGPVDAYALRLMDELMDKEVHLAPLVLSALKGEYPVVKNWIETREPLAGYRRIEGAALLGIGVVVRLEFMGIMHAR